MNDIEYGIPIPPRQRGHGRPRGSFFTDRIRALEVGASILFDSERELNHARQVIKKMGWAYEQRKSRDGWRIWRTE